MWMLRKMEADIAAFQSRLKELQVSVAKKAKGIEEGEADLSDLLTSASAKVRQFYIRGFYQSPFQVLLSTDDVGNDETNDVPASCYRSSKKDIARTAVAVTNLEERKKELETEQSSLSYIKEETDKRAVTIRKLVSDATAYQSQVSGFIASLTAQQQAILNARGGTFTTSVGDVPLSDDPNSRPTFNPGFSPAFAGFSFGAYTHRKGMSQYGAKGRAEKGQSSADILRAYYGKNPENRDTGGNITVQGVGSVNFEDFLSIRNC